MLKSTCQLGKEAFLDIVFNIAIGGEKGSIESRRQEVKIFKGTLSSGIGLKLPGSDVSPLLCIRTVQAFSIHQGYCQKSISGTLPQ